MRSAVLLALLLLPLGAADIDRDFSGEWNLNLKKSVIRYLPFAPENSLRVEHDGQTIRCISGAEWTFTPGSNSTRNVAGTDLSSAVKWEGNALLITTLASANPPYTLADRWQLSKDRRTLSIQRQYLAASGQMDSKLVYERVGEPPAALVSTVRPPAPPKPAKPVQTEFVVEKGTRIPLVSITETNTKQAVKGDFVFLNTSAPVVVDGRVVIPKGSEVSATVSSVKRPGRAKGRAELFLHFDSITLPSGVVRDLTSQLNGMENASVDSKEGAIQGAGSKKKDAGKIGGAAGAGAGVGTMAGGRGLGTGVGAAAGAAAGLAGVLGTRGPDIYITKGTAMEMVLDRDLKYLYTEIPPVPGKVR